MAAGTNAKVIVIGPGPAGVRAAHALVEAGLRRTIIDEEGRDGGQIYRRQLEAFSSSYETLYGTGAERAASAASGFRCVEKPHRLQAVRNWPRIRNRRYRGVFGNPSHSRLSGLEAQYPSTAC